MPEYILAFACPDRLGLVRAVSDWLFHLDCNIIDSDQFGDAEHQRFFMRVHFSGPQTCQDLMASFADVAASAQMDWGIWPIDVPPKVAILVSKQDHCLLDLLYRTRNGELPIDIQLIASNHRDAYPVAAAHDIDFLHAPVTADTKAKQESQLAQAFTAHDIDFVVLARYMQILSPTLCEKYPGRIINIHHSFLPSFKGAKPYHQAFEKGVKLIGATAHYVTTDLDEGPIIEQGVERVDHRATASDFVAVGRDIERMVLSKAVKYHAQRRVLRNGARTVVFR